MGKRGNHEGTIRKRKDGRFEARTTIGYTSDGKQNQQSKYFKKKEDAAAWLAGIQMAQRTGQFVQPDKITVGDWMKKWLPTYAKPKLAVTSYDSYENWIDCHIIPAIGKIELQKLRPIDVQKMYADLLDHGRKNGTTGGLAHETVRRIHNVLHGALRQAVLEGLIQRNPTDAVTPPRPVKQEINPWSDETVEQFWAVSKRDRLHALFVTARGTAMRRGELLALNWDTVDLEKGTATVKRTLARVKNRDGDPDKPKTVLIFKEPKRGKFRTVPLPHFVVKALKAHKAKQNEERLFFGEKYQNNGLVFCTEDGKPLDPRNVLARFKRLLKKAKMPDTRFHNWRHTCATLLLGKNVHPKVVSEMLGHSKIAITLDTYSHVVPGMLEAAAAKLDEVFDADDDQKKENLSAKGEKL